MPKWLQRVAVISAAVMVPAFAMAGQAQAAESTAWQSQVILVGDATMSVAQQVENQFPLPTDSSLFVKRIVAVAGGAVAVLQDVAVPGQSATWTTYSAPIQPDGSFALTQTSTQSELLTPTNAPATCGLGCELGLEVASHGLELCLEAPSTCAAVAAAATAEHFICDGVCESLFKDPTCVGATNIGGANLNGIQAITDEGILQCDTTVDYIQVYAYYEIVGHGRTDEIPIGSCSSSPNCAKGSKVTGGTPGLCYVAHNEYTVSYHNVTGEHTKSFSSDSNPRAYCFSTVGSLSVGILSVGSLRILPATVL